MPSCKNFLCRATPLALATAAALAAGAAPPAAAATATEDAAAQLPSFDTRSTGCETHPQYDPQWASRGTQYGADRLQQGDFVSGFYQIAGDGKQVYAAFGGALHADRSPVAGITPGALVVLDADTLALQRFIPLPFHGYALTLQPAHKRAIVSHSRAQTLSIVDLDSGALRCIQPDTQAGEHSYRNRYVTSDPAGNFYVSYYAGRGDAVRATVAKFDGEGHPLAAFKPHTTDTALALPALYRNGQVYTGGQRLVAVDADSGIPRPILARNTGWSIYNYAAGPGDSLLAVNYQSDTSPNLWLLDPAHNASSALFSGTGSLEAVHVPESGQVFVSNFSSHTVTVAELPANGRQLDAQRFVNIAFDGMPLGLYARRTRQGTEVFVTPKWEGDLIQKITIAPQVRGIDGITAPGACTITSFDLADQSVSPPQPCRILDAQASYRSLHTQAQQALQYAEQTVGEAQQQLTAAQHALQQARQGGQANAQDLATRQQQLETAERQLRSARKAQSASQTHLAITARLAER